MPSTHVPAAATGLPSAISSRRAFLGASIAVALAGSPAAAAAAECPLVLALAERRAEARKAVSGAEAAFAEARERCIALWPETPKHMRFLPGTAYEWMGVLEEETDVDGKPVWVAEQLAKGIRWRGYRIPSVEGLRTYLAENPKDMSRRMLRRWLATAEALQARRQEAIEAAGFDKAERAMWGARGKLEYATRDLAAAKPRTLGGVLAKAEAMAEAEGLSTEQQFMTRNVMGPAIADDLVRLLRSSLTS